MQSIIKHQLNNILNVLVNNKITFSDVSYSQNISSIDYSIVIEKYAITFNKNHYSIDFIIELMRKNKIIFSGYSQDTANISKTLNLHIW